MLGHTGRDFRLGHLETLRAYAREGVVRVEYVILIALIALARKVIVSPPGEPSAKLFGVAALIAALAAAHLLLRHARGRD